MGSANDDEFRFKHWRENKLNTLKFNRIICLLICGQPVSAIAKEIGISTRTIERYFADNGFNENLTTAINLTFKKGLAEAALFADKAVQILIEISEDNTQSPKYRLQAIALLFKVCADVRLRQSYEETAQAKLDKQHRLLMSMRSINALIEPNSKGLPAGKIEIENQKLIWAELYPNEPFPDDESFKQWFQDPEKPNY